MTPSVEFRTGVDDPVRYAAAWARKAVALGARARICGAADQLATLDRLLWSDPPDGFTAHRRTAATQPPGAWRTPLWLGVQEVAGSEPALVLNLAGALPALPGERERVIEVVGATPEAAAEGRRRWAAWVALGVQPSHRAARAGAAADGD